MQAGVSEVWSIARRQPSSALLMVLYKTITQLLRAMWPVLLIWLFNTARKDTKVETWEIAIASSSVLYLLHSIVLFYTFRFSIVNDELLIKKGYLVRTQLALPLHRIQAVHIDENWLHQLLDLSQVSLDSPGTEKTEVRITMRKREAESFRLFITDQQQPEPGLLPTTPKQSTLFKLSTTDLWKLGFSANHLEAFFIMLAFGFSTLDNLERAIDFQFSGFLRWLTDIASSSTSAALGMVAIIILILSIILSVLRIALQYGRFEMSETDKGFRIQSGLINLKEKLIPFTKIQYISWKGNWLRSQLPIYLLHFHAIGDENMKKKWTIRIPITRDAFIDTLLSYYHPSLAHLTQFVRINFMYVLRRFWMAGCLPAFAFIAIGFPFWGWLSTWILLLPAYTLLSAFLFQRKFKLYIGKDALQIHQGVFGKEDIVLRWTNIQSISIRQGIYQRRHGLATLRLHTADRSISIPFITLLEAERIRDYGIYVVEAS